MVYENREYYLNRKW